MLCSKHIFLGSGNRKWLYKNKEPVADHRSEVVLGLNALFLESFRLTLGQIQDAGRECEDLG